MKQQSKLVNFFIIFTFTLLYLFVSIISMIHTVAFFQLSNPYEILAISLAVAFELGAAASLATVVTQDAMNKFIVWSLFIILTLFQMMGNTYYAYANLKDYNAWVELFNLMDLSEIEQKRYLAIISGAILPIVALGYIKCLVDYLKSKQPEAIEDVKETVEIQTPVTDNEPDASTKELEIPFIEYHIAEEPKEEVKEVEEPVQSAINEQLSKETEEFLENEAQQEAVEEPAVEEQKQAKKSTKDSLFFKKKAQNDLKKTSNK